MDFLAAQLPEKIGLLESNGDYKGAIKEIDSELESYLPSIMTRRLLWEKERILVKIEGR